MSTPIDYGWRYYGCARWGCNAVNPDYLCYGTRDGRSWCLHHRPGRLRRLLMAMLPAAPPAEIRGPLLPIGVVQRHYLRRQDGYADTTRAISALHAGSPLEPQGEDGADVA
jgi:hypothetical protein